MSRRSKRKRKTNMCFGTVSGGYVGIAALTTSLQTTSTNQRKRTTYKPRNIAHQALRTPQKGTATLTRGHTLNPAHGTYHSATVTHHPAHADTAIHPVHAMHPVHVIRHSSTVTHRPVHVIRHTETAIHPAHVMHHSATVMIRPAPVTCPSETAIHPVHATRHSATMYSVTAATRLPRPRTENENTTGKTSRLCAKKINK